jgi:hypothetical protein
VDRVRVDTSVQVAESVGEALSKFIRRLHSVRNGYYTVRVVLRVEQ